MTDYDDMMRELPDDIMNDIHAYYYRDLPYLNELNRVNQSIIDYEGLVEVHGERKYEDAEKNGIFM